MLENDGWEPSGKPQGQEKVTGILCSRTSQSLLFEDSSTDCQGWNGPQGAVESYPGLKNSRQVLVPLMCESAQRPQFPYLYSGSNTGLFQKVMRKLK